MITKSWQQILLEAEVFIRFLGKDSFYDTPYQASLANEFVTTDAAVARRFATDDSFDDFDEWESLTDSPPVFPDDFEWSQMVTHQLKKNACFGMETKGFNGAIEKWTNPASCPLAELMLRDVRIIFQCYANGYFPDIWKRILQAYLNNGFPCGWTGRYPAGKLVVFSNG